MMADATEEEEIGKMKTFKVITTRVVLDEVSYAVKKSLWKKRVFVNAETIEEKEDGTLVVTAGTPIQETIVPTDELV